MAFTGRDLPPRAPPLPPLCGRFLEAPGRRFFWPESAVDAPGLRLRCDDDLLFMLFIEIGLPLPYRHLFGTELLEHFRMTPYCGHEILLCFVLNAKFFGSLRYYF